jgi:hypothetical protein
MQRFTRQKYLAAMLSRRTNECVHQGGFTCAVTPEKRQRFALCQGKADVVQNHRFVIARAQMLNTQ